MREIQLLIFILTFYNSVFSQQFNGEYTEFNDYINFNNDSVDFKIIGNGCLAACMKGNGIYKIADDFLIINTSQYKGSNSHSIKSKSDDKSLHFTILDPNNDPIIGANIILKDSNGKVLSGTLANMNGQATIAENEKASLILISFFGYDNHTINYSGRSDYKVNLMDYDIIENSTVVFKINSLNSDTLSLILLAIDFKGKTQGMTDLKKLEKKSYKYQYRIRTFTKQ